MERGDEWGPRPDWGPRPEAVRPNQRSANSCENLRNYGRCRWGDECYYAHSQEESEVFAAWARGQKVRRWGGLARAGGATPAGPLSAPPL